MKANIAQIVAAFAEYYDKTLSTTQLKMYVEDLGFLSPEQLSTAVKKYRMDPANIFFPLPAKLIEIVAAADGRPGVEEAWSMLPKDESASVVWTQEMAAAYGTAHPLLKTDTIAARMAFKEKYSGLMREARLSGVPVEWALSGGYDRSSREAALRIAVAKNQLNIETAKKIMPEISFENEASACLNKDVRTLINETFARGIE